MSRGKGAPDRSQLGQKCITVQYVKDIGAVSQIHASYVVTAERLYWSYPIVNMPLSQVIVSLFGFRCAAVFPFELVQPARGGLIRDRRCQYR